MQSETHEADQSFDQCVFCVERERESEKKEQSNQKKPNKTSDGEGNRKWQSKHELEEH
jgi:hypothetical protein